MKARTFNSGIMPYVNEKWVATVLNMQKNPTKGPDLISDGKFVELKFCLIKPKNNRNNNYPTAWTVLDHQVEYEEFFIGQGFWGLGFYELDRAVKKIITTFPEDLESMVIHRELYVVQWSWMNQFPPHTVRGKTKFSEWENTFRYLKFSKLPQISRTYKVEKGLIYFTQGVPEYMFELG